jgi:hypothetical protein
MRAIDRLYRFMERKKLNPFNLERSCGLSNGYIASQLKSKGSIGSEILEKISHEYPELNLVWLITGKGKMVLPLQNKYNMGVDDTAQVLKENEAAYTAKNKLIGLMKQHLSELEYVVLEKRRRKRQKRSPLVRVPTNQ